MNSVPPVCATCGRRMRYSGLLPAIGQAPELLTFECRDCERVADRGRLPARFGCDFTTDRPMPALNGRT